MDNSVKLCCVDKGGPIGNLSENSIEEIRNSEEFNNLRKSFLNGEKLDRCKECWNHEKHGYHSYRQSNNQDYIDQLPEEIFHDEPLELTYLDYRPSNLCNLACKICSPRFSSKLIDPWLQVGQLSSEEGLKLTKLNSNRIDVNTVKDKFSNIEFIYFAGGEPLIADDHWDLLEFFSKKDPENIRIKYNTNLTKLDFKGKSIEQYWSKFQQVLIGASLDGYGVEFEHLRTGAKWKDIVENLERLKAFIETVKKQAYDKWGYPKRGKGLELYCDSTVGWLNLKSVFKLHKFMYENNYVILDNVNYTKLLAKPLNFPYGASLACTPPELKDELLDSLSSYKEWVISICPHDSTSWISDLDSLTSIIENSEYREKELRDWLRISKHLDSKYKLNTPKAFQFNNESWNRKFTQMYNDTELI